MTFDKIGDPDTTILINDVEGRDPAVAAETNISIVVGMPNLSLDNVWIAICRVTFV